MNEITVNTDKDVNIELKIETKNKFHQFKVFNKGLGTVTIQSPCQETIFYNTTQNLEKTIRNAYDECETAQKTNQETN